MVPRMLLLLLLPLARAAASGEGARVGDDASPIRRVVAMLQAMQRKVIEEGQKDKQLFEKFMCYCEGGRTSLKKDVEAALTKLPQLDSNLKENAAEQARLKDDVKKSESDRAEAQDALKEGRNLRETEAAAYVKDRKQNEANVKALTQAVAVLNRGGGGFLQTSSISMIRGLLDSVRMSSSDRDAVESFFSQSRAEGESPASSEIVGMLSQMKESMQKDMEEAALAEQSARREFEIMARAKEEQIAALTKEIKVKTARIGQVGMELANMKGDYDATTKMLKDDQAFMATLAQSCTDKQSQMTERDHVRAEELSAIKETIKMLNEGEALDIFKRTLPIQSFLQIQETHSAHQDLGKTANRQLTRLLYSVLDKNVGFQQVIKMVEGMVQLLHKEQTADDEKLEYCQTEMNRAEDRKKDLDMTIADISKTIEEGRAKAAGLQEDIAALLQGIQVLDTQVTEATKQRKAEHEEFITDLAANNAAQELIVLAKRRLERFYRPVKPALVSVDARRMGSAVGADDLAADAGEVDAAALVQEKPGAAPPLPGAYKPHEDGSAVIRLLNSIADDLEREIQAMKSQEKVAQANYEAAMKDAAAKRSTDARTIAEKEGIKADVDTKNHKVEQEMKTKKQESDAIVQIIQDLHKECDSLQRNFQARKKARESELRGLRAVTAILNGGENPLALRQRWARLHHPSRPVGSLTASPAAQSVQG